MRLTNLVVPTVLALASTVPAQVGWLRGEVRFDDALGYHMDVTGWPAKLLADIPDGWLGQPLLLKATNLGTATAPVVGIEGAEPTTRIFGLGELRVGALAKGWVVGSGGSFVMACFDSPSNLQWTNLDGTGVWLLGPDPSGVVLGAIMDVDDMFRFSFPVPMWDVLVGVSLVGQAAVFDPSAISPLLFSNPEGRTVQPQ